MLFLLGFIVGLLNAILVLVVSMRYRKTIEEAYQSLGRSVSPPSSQAEIIMPVGHHIRKSEEVMTQAIRDGRDHVSLQELYDDPS